MSLFQFWSFFLTMVQQAGIYNRGKIIIQRLKRDTYVSSMIAASATLQKDYSVRSSALKSCLNSDIPSQQDLLCGAFCFHKQEFHN